MDAKAALQEIKDNPTVDIWPTAALALGVARPTIYQMHLRGDLECIRVGRRIRVLSAPLRKLLCIEPATTATDASLLRPPAPMPKARPGRPRKRDDDRYVWRKDLWCHVGGLAYDYRSSTGRLWMKEGDCCDMGGAIQLFESFDKDVSKIITFSGSQKDTLYNKRRGRWEAFSE